MKPYPVVDEDDDNDDDTDDADADADARRARSRAHRRRAGRERAVKCGATRLGRDVDGDRGEWITRERDGTRVDEGRGENASAKVRLQAIE